MKKIYLFLLTSFALNFFSNAQTVTIGTGTSSTLSTSTNATSLHSPYNSYYGYSYVQTLYLQSEINTAGNITSISYYFSGTSLTNSNSVKVYMAHVTRSTFASTTDWEPLANLTTVFDGTISAGTLPGLVTINLTTPFSYNNTANLLIAIDENAPGDSGSSGYRTSNLGSNRVLFYRSDTNNPDPSAPPTANGRSSSVGNIQMTILSASACYSTGTVSTSSITTNSATVSWVAPTLGATVSQYNWELRTSGAAGSGATGLVSSGNSSTPSVPLSSLASGSNYNFYVRSDCGSGSTSTWTSTVFTTACATYNLPYTVDFNSAAVPALPTCMSKEDINSDTYSWATFTPVPPTATIPTTLVRYSYNTASAGDDWLYTGGLNLSAGTTYQLKFKYKASDGPTYVEKLEVKYGTTAAVAGMTSSAIFSNTSIASALADPYADANVTFTVPTSGVYYLGFHAFSAADQAYLYVDDINVQVLPTCDQPTNITPSAVTPTTATVSWTAPTVGTVTNYSWEVRTSGAAGSGATGLVNSGTTATTSVNLISLPSDATLTFYVKTICTNPDVSTYNSAVFATPAQPPVNDDFCSAITLTLNGTVDCENTSAATSTNDPTYSNSTANNTTWYKYTPATAGAATVAFTRPAGAAALDCLDGWLAIYTATGTCPSLSFTEVTSSISYDLTSSSNVVVTTPSLAAGTTYYFMVDGVAGAFGKYCIQVISPLPVSLTSFKGERQGANNLLSWTTATETNNTGFELQRSTDGTNFSQLAFVASKASNGNSNANLTYTFTDTKSLIAGSYYRLKQIDRDGKSTVSQVVFIKGVKVSKLELVSIYPNPAIDRLNIALVSPKADNVTFVVSDLSGKVIIKQTASVNNGDNNINVNVSNLAKGTYTIKAICADGCETAISKFVKQ